MNDTFMKTKPVFPLLVSMALPNVISMLVNSLYNIVDSLFVAQINEQAMTALSLVFPIQNFVNAVAIGFGVGINALVALYRGAGDHDKADAAATHGMALSVLHGLLCTLLATAIMPGFLARFTADSTIVSMGVTYSAIVFFFAIVNMASLAFEKIFQAVGRMKLTMLALISGCVCNILLDPILIFGLGWGVRGAAVATVLSQAVGACWILKFLTGPKTILKLRKAYLRVERGVILPVLGLGISSFVMLSTESLLSISFSSSLARYGGDVAVGAMTVITSASQLCTLPIQGICQGGQPVMSFNFGAGKKPRVKEAFRFQLTLCFGYTTLFWLLMMLVPGVVAGIFTSDTALIDYTTWAMRIYMAGILAMGVQIACQQSFMALGQAKVSLLLACLRKIILLIPLIFILPHFVADKCFGVFLAEPVSDLLAATITAITFFSRFDKILDRGAGRA